MKDKPAHPPDRKFADRSVDRRTRVQLLIVALGVSAMQSCAASGPTRGGPEDRAATESNALRSRAEILWRSKAAGDCKTAFAFEEPAERTDEAAFVAWCANEDPFRILDYTLHAAQTDGDFGWVRVAGRVQFARAPNAPIEEVDAWYKWHKVDGEWLPVSNRALASFPEAPALRIKDEESRLQQRFAQAWEARHARDWRRLYELSDPADRRVIPEEQLVETEGDYACVAHELHWTEVIGDRGRVRVTYTTRLTDPNLTKLPARDVGVTEYWILRNGEWFLDLKRP